MHIFMPISRSPTPTDYWETFETSLNLEYYSRVCLLLGLFYLVFLTCPSLLQLFVRPLKKAPKTQIYSFCTDVASIINSGSISLISLYSAFFYLPYGRYDYMFYAFRWSNSLVCAYMVTDTVFRCFYVRRNFAFMLMHHVVGIALSQSSMYDEHWQTPKLIFLLMELANPFISCRFMAISIGR